MRFIIVCTLLSLVLGTGATAQERGWGAFRGDTHEKDAETVRELQQLLMGRESVLQSHDETDRGRIAIEREMEGLYQDRIATEKAIIGYEEALDSFLSQEEDEQNEPQMPEETENLFWATPEPELERLVEPTRVRVCSLSQTIDGIQLVLENLGDPVDALVSVTDAQSTIIGMPIHQELSDWDDPRQIFFRLRKLEEKVNILVYTNDAMLHIPLFLHQQVVAPRILAFPSQRSARVGTVAEYTVMVEGDPEDRQRYAIRVEGLPKGIEWQMLRTIPSGQTNSSEKESRTAQIHAVEFSASYPRYELTLRLKVYGAIPGDKLNKPLEFRLYLGNAFCEMTIVPLGVGALSLEVPASPVSIGLEESASVTITAGNHGTESIQQLRVQALPTVYGIAVEPIDIAVLKPGERRPIELTVTAARDATIGQHRVQLTATSDFVTQTADLSITTQPKPYSLNLLRGLVAPALIAVALVLAIYVGSRLQRMRQQRLRYDLREGEDR